MEPGKTGRSEEKNCAGNHRAQFFLKEELSCSQVGLKHTSKRCQGCGRELDVAFYLFLSHSKNLKEIIVSFPDIGSSCLKILTGIRILVIKQSSHWAKHQVTELLSNGSSGNPGYCH